MDYLKYKGYTGSVEYSFEDDCLVGHVLGMNKDSITYEGQSLEQLKDDFKAGIDSYLDGCKVMGMKPQKPYSGNFNVRISSELHAHIAAFAEQSGISINAFIKETLSKALL